MHNITFGGNWNAEKYADCSVTAVIKVLFVYLSRGNFAFVLSRFSSRSPLSNVNCAKRLLSPSLGVKDIGLLFMVRVC